ncbi:MAG: hypothetical protein J6Y02_24150 [Pseudobutyrivibrio sp.]|nr:hypothetical protein [Pseudobutyrivibrio sp.]
MGIQVNETGNLKTVGTSSSVFIECFGNPSYGNNLSVGNGVAVLNLPKNIDVEYELPFTPSRVLITCRNTSGFSGPRPLIGLTQGETVATPPVPWSYFANGNYGPSSVQLSGDKLIFGKASADTYLSAVVIAKE